MIPAEEYVSRRDKALAEAKRLVGKMDERKFVPRWVPLVIELVELANTAHDAMMATGQAMSAYTDGLPSNGRRHWTEEEDQELIEHICDGDSVPRCAVVFGRTPAAIANRLTYLVGVRRLYIKVDGTFTGTLDGVEDVEADVQGVVLRR